MRQSPNNFWDRVERCNHDRLSDYYAPIFCSVCHDGGEWHCLECGVFISECACGCSNGMARTSKAQRRATKRRKIKAGMEQERAA